MTAEERFQVETDAAEMFRSLPLNRADMTAEHRPTLSILFRLVAVLKADAELLNRTPRVGEAASTILAAERILVALTFWLHRETADPLLCFLEDPDTGRIEEAVS